MSPRLTEELEEQKLRLASELEEQRAVQDARRDYEYEARKRLYGECEPLLFEAAELAERARSRIMSIARTCRQGDLLPDGSGWLAGPGYYFRSTVCFLLAPMTSFKILQHRLTVIDLSLEPRLRTQYELLKLIFRTFTEDHDLARCEPELEYKPDRADPGRPDRERLLRQSPTGVPAPGALPGNTRDRHRGDGQGERRRRLPVPELRRVPGRAGRQPVRDHRDDAGPHRALPGVPPPGATGAVAGAGRPGASSTTRSSTPTGRCRTTMVPWPGW